MFKPGDIVKCIDDDNGDYGIYLIVGRNYTVVIASDVYVSVKDETGGTRPHFASRFQLCAPATVPNMIGHVKPDRDQAETRLLSRWKAVPDRCCPKCAAPLPCNYHPVSRENDSSKMRGDIDF